MPDHFRQTDIVEPVVDEPAGPNGLLKKSMLPPLSGEKRAWSIFHYDSAPASVIERLGLAHPEHVYLRKRSLLAVDQPGRKGETRIGLSGTLYGSKAQYRPFVASCSASGPSMTLWLFVLKSRSFVHCNALIPTLACRHSNNAVIQT